MNTNHTHDEQNAESSEQKTFSLDRILKSFLRFWWVCVLLALILAGVALYRDYINYKPVYTTSVTFTVQTQTGISGYDVGLTSYSFTYNRSAAKQLSTTFPNIIRSHILQDIVCNDMGITYFPCTLSASSVPDTNLFTITAKGANPDTTYEVLQSVIKNYPAVSEYVLGNTQLKILHQPSRPTSPSNTFVYRTTILKYALIGFAIGMLWVIFYASRRNTVCTRSDVRKKLNQTCIGTLPEVIFKRHKQQVVRSVSINNPLVGNGYMESFRALRNSIVNKLEDKKIILVTSTAPGEGKTSVSSNLATSLAKMHKNVLLIEGDLRNPSVCDFFGITEETPCQVSSDKLRSYRYPVSETDSLNILCFPEGDALIWDILKPKYLEKLFGLLREKFDYIIVDTSPIGITSEPSVFAQFVDCALMVIKQDTVRTASIIESLDNLLSSDVELLGCILNGTSTGYGSYGYGHYGSYGRYGYGRYGYGRYGYGRYGYGYGYGYGESKSKKKSKSSRSKSH